MKNTLLFMISLLVLLGFACQSQIEPPIEYGPNPEAAAILAQTLNLPSNPYTYTKMREGHFSSDFHEPLESDLITLGRVLFYDKTLSADNSISCASCHVQSHAFADDKAFSDGVFGNVTDRNLISLAMLKTASEVYGQTHTQPRLFWDERSSSTAVQILQTLSNKKEMDMDPYELPGKLEQKDYYQILWENVSKNYRPDAPFMSTPDITRALGEFMASIQGNDSRFDRGFRAHGILNDNFPDFTPSENLGKSLFLQNCASCHGFSLGTNASSFLPHFNKTTACNGLDREYEDKGVGSLRNNPFMDGRFKIPGLRNVEVTGPYMHDGRFESLEEVVEHYNSNIQPHKNLDPFLKNGNDPLQMDMTPDEMTALVDFLKTLTDQNLLYDPKWSDPFRE